MFWSRKPKHEAALERAKTLLSKLRADGDRLVGLTQGEIDEAESQLRIACEAAPDNIEAAALYGKVLWRLGRGYEGVPHLERALGLANGGRDWLLAAEALAGVWLQHGRPVDALPVLERALPVADEEFERGLAWKKWAALMALSRFDDAEAHLDWALGKWPGDPELEASREEMHSERAARAPRMSDGSAPSADLAAKMREQEKLTQTFQAELMRLMHSSEPQPAKDAKMAALQDEYQRAVQALYAT